MKSSLNQQEYQREISFSDIRPSPSRSLTAILQGSRYFRGRTRADRRGNTLPRILAVSPFISSSSGGCRLRVVVFTVNVRRLTASASSLRGWTRPRG